MGVYIPRDGVRIARRSISSNSSSNNTWEAGRCKDFSPSDKNTQANSSRNCNSRTTRATAFSEGSGSGRRAATSSSSNSSASSTWCLFFGRQRSLPGPSQWQLMLGAEAAPPLLMASCVAAAAAVAAASSVTAVAATAPASAVRFLPVPELCTQQKEQIAALVGRCRGGALEDKDAAASRTLATTVSLHSPSPAGGFSVAAVEEDHAQEPEHSEQQQPLLLPGSSHKGHGQQRADQQETDEAYMSWKEVWHVFGIAALPMVGFGLMDQLIMIRLGDLLDTTLGVKFGLATLSAAAVGQLCSDTAGVLFGSTIESCANRLGFPSPNLTAAQRASAVFSLTKTLGAALGVCCGCLLGMLQLLVLDLDRADRLKHQQQLDTILETVLVDGPKLFHCESAALYVYDSSRDEIWSKAVFGEDKAIRMQKQKSKCFTTWVIENKAILNCPEASEDPRFNPEFDEKTQQKTRSVLAAPVMNASGDVIAALMFFNKHPQFRGRFSEDDERMVEMMSRHVQIFMEKFEYGAAEDHRMISLPESEHVSQYHAAGVSADTAKQSADLPQRGAATISDRSSVISSVLGTGDESHGAMEATSINLGKGEWLNTTSAASEDAGPQQALGIPTVRCSTCRNTGCVLLHSLGPSTVQQTTTVHQASLSERTSGPVGSMRRGLATAAVAAATAAGIDTVAADGARAWWLRWLFCLPEDDDYALLPPDGATPAAVEREEGCGEASEGGDDSPPGGGDPKRREGPPPPYWKSTFPHLYGSTSTSSAKIVEVDRQ